MEFKKEGILVILGILILIVFLNNNLTGKSTTLANIENPMQEDEYFLYINEANWIAGERVELLDVSENKDAIIKINNEIRSISDAGIVSNGLQIEKSVAIKGVAGKRSFAILKIIIVEQGKEIECRETDDEDNIYLKGVCYDKYYKMGIEDYCDGIYLREFSCEYDNYVDEVHCMRNIIRCNNLCKQGSCVSEIKSY